MIYEKCFILNKAYTKVINWYAYPHGNAKLSAWNSSVYRVYKKNMYFLICQKALKKNKSLGTFFKIATFSIGNAAFSKSANNNKLIFKLRCNNVLKIGRTYHVISFRQVQKRQSFTTFFKSIEGYNEKWRRWRIDFYSGRQSLLLISRWNWTNFLLFNLICSVFPR